MKDRLPGEYHQSLDTPKGLPEPDDLQRAVCHRVRWFNTSFGMIMPSINQNLFLLNHVRRLALPLEVYTTVRRLNTITKYDFAYPDLTKSQETTRRLPTTYPESQLMSLVVVATKLLFPFDSDTLKRYSKDPNDPTTLRMDWSAWLHAKSAFDKANEAAADPNRLKPGSEIHVKDTDILDMTDQQLDQYMDWYQLTWIKNSGTSRNQDDRGIDKEILDMFPLHDVSERTKTRDQNNREQAEEDARLTQRIKLVQSTLKSRRAISEEEEIERDLNILRPGARYPRFLKLVDLDRAGRGYEDGENVVKTFHEEAAQAACLSVKALLQAVNRTEEKIEQWLVARRREEFFADEESEADQVDEEAAHDEQGEDMKVVPETSPPAKLAMELGGLGLGLSPYFTDDDGDVDMQMLAE